MRIRIAETELRAGAIGTTRKLVLTITEEEPSPHLQPKNFSSTQPTDVGQTEETRHVVAVPTGVRPAGRGTCEYVPRREIESMPP